MAEIPRKENVFNLYDYIDKNMVNTSKTFCNKISHVYPISDNLVIILFKLSIRFKINIFSNFLARRTINKY